MPNLNHLFVNEESRPVVVSGQKITFISRALRLAVPQGFGGLIWNRPVAVRVQTADGAEFILPVVDETRRRQIAIFIAGLVLVLFISLVAGRRFD